MTANQNAFDRTYNLFVDLLRGHLMNAPERITSLQVAPGVLLLRPDVPVDLELRRKAIASLLRQMRRAKPSPPGESGRDYLARVRARHGTCEARRFIQSPGQPVSTPSAEWSGRVTSRSSC